MLSISGLSKSFGGRTLFADASLQVNREDRIGLVGPNGAGKSTLLALILGEESPDEGKVDLERNITLGYLPQETAPAVDQTVLELASAISPEFSKLQKLIHAWDHDHPEATEYHDDLHTRFEDLGGYRVEAKAKKILAGLSFRETDFHRPAKEMSGGWIMRTHLARLLVQEPDLLLLDEPATGLTERERERLAALVKDIAAQGCAQILVEHDLELVGRLCNRVTVVNQGHHIFTGTPAAAQREPEVVRAYLGMNQLIGGGQG